MKAKAVCLVFVCALVIRFSEALVQTFDVPLELAKCYGYFRNRTSLSHTPAASIQSFCDNSYSWHHAKELNVHRGAIPQTTAYINNLFKSTKQEITQHNSGRRKRQANPKLRIRKEIRMLTDSELKLFFDAVNSAKKNTTISPNKYDALAEFHTGITSVSAHGGCNFHGWHRVYILMFENALREEGPQFADVTVPYWDTTLDSKMSNPLQSVLFTDRFMGSCQGAVHGGIMGTGWESTTGTITRNCGTDGPLITDEVIFNVTRRSRMSAMCGENSEIDDDLEFHHNGVHRWIDGQMAILASAVYDPVFWIYHCFIDKVWEDFRENQKRNGVNPETDYPQNPVTMGAVDLHRPNASMGFADLTVLDGLSAIYTTEWYQYARSPTCEAATLDCGSKYLKCVQISGKFRCVGRTLSEVEAFEAQLNKPPPTVVCETATPQPTTSLPTAPHPPTTLPVPSNQHNVPKEIQPVQNTYCMNGKSDIGQWVYVPVKIILKRPPDFSNYGSYPVERGKIVKGRGDIYAPGAYSNVNIHLRRPENPAKYENCIEPTTPTNTIYVKSVGLNYEGTYKEFAIMDKRLALTIATAYIAIKKPLSLTDVSWALLHAQDSCGRVCKPICKVPGTEIFRPCSGAVRVTGGQPLQFGNTFGDAVLDVWDFNTDKNCPQMTQENIIVSFYCDYGTEWVWPSVAPGSQGAIHPSPPKPHSVPGCALGWGCTVNKPCSEMTACNDGEIIECVKSCHMYAKCFKNSFMVYQCRRGERYLSGSGCIKAGSMPCDYSTSGLL